MRAVLFPPPTLGVWALSSGSSSQGVWMQHRYFLVKQTRRPMDSERSPFPRCRCWGRLLWARPAPASPAGAHGPDRGRLAARGSTTCPKPLRRPSRCSDARAWGSRDPEWLGPTHSGVPAAFQSLSGHRTSFGVSGNDPRRLCFRENSKAYGCPVTAGGERRGELLPSWACVLPVPTSRPDRR